MRIAQFSDCYTPRINGVTTSIQILKRSLEELGHEVTLFVPDYPGAQTQPESGVVRVRSVYMPLQPEDRMMVPWARGRCPALWQSHFDVVHIHTPFAAGWTAWLKARKQRIPMVFTHHTLWEEYAHYLRGIPEGLGRWVGREICDFYFRRSAAVVMPSQEVAHSLVGHRVHGCYRVIPTGIICQDFRGGDPGPVWQELQLPSGSPIMLYIGRMGKEKSIDFLLQSFAEYRMQGGQATFVLIGGGPELENLKALSRQLGIEAMTRFLGYRQLLTLKHYLAAARAFLFASQTETQGLVLLEAAAAGVPVIAARASGVNEAVKDNYSGILLTPGDQDGFVKAMLRLEQEPTYQTALSRQAQVWAEGFSSQEMGRKMLDLYGFVCA